MTIDNAVCSQIWLRAYIAFDTMKLSFELRGNRIASRRKTPHSLQKVAQIINTKNLNP